MSLSKFCRSQGPNFRFNFRTYNPCGVCASHCDQNDLILNCEICLKSYHRSCKKVSKSKYKELKNHNYVCSSKCYLSLLPLTSVDEIDFFSALFGENKYPCGHCNRDCLEMTPCIQCSICDDWIHYQCSNLNESEFLTNSYYFCSRECEISLLPFANCNTPALISDEILTKSTTLARKKKDKSLNYSTPKKTRGKKFVDTDKFMEVNCAYLYPYSLDRTYLQVSESDLTIYQNNIRSLNKNLHIVKEIFFKCEKLPDIMSFCETKLKNDSTIPNIDGYSFHHRNSPTGSGGVGNVFYGQQTSHFPERKSPNKNHGTGV